MSINITSEPYFGQPNLEYYLPVNQGEPIDPVMFFAESSYNVKTIEWWLTGNLPAGLEFSSRRAIGADIMGTPTQNYYSREHAWVHVMDTEHNEEAVIPIGFEVRPKQHADYSDVPPPHTDIHTDHADSSNDYHGDHTDTYHTNTVGGEVHSDVEHKDHSDHVDATPVHTDVIQRLHGDHTDADKFPLHSDVAPPDLGAPPPKFLKVRFDPGGEAPEPIDMIFKKGQTGDRSRTYTIYNDGKGILRVTIHNMPSGVTANPKIVTIPPGESGQTVITVTENYFNNLSTGETQRNLDVKMELLGEPIG